MKLLVYDKFWDAFIKLPKSIQREVIQFQKKFRENSKSSAINLESISSFKDSSLRTARINQKYRAIIKAPSSGDVFYLLWVDNHDEAMNWASNKMFKWNENTQSVQVFYAPETFINESARAVVSEKQGIFSRYRDQDLLIIGIPEILLPSVNEIFSIDDLEKIEKFIPVDVFENLFYLADGGDIEKIIREIKEGTSNSTNINEQEISINNQRSFIELTDDELFNDVLSGNLNKWKYYLHPSQRKLVNGEFSGAVKISGGAGTGKTVAALHRLKYLSGKIVGDQKILFTTYTKALTENLKLLVKDLEICPSSYVIKNIDALAFEFITKYKIINSDIKIFGYNSVKSPEEIWEDILETELITYDCEFLLKEYRDVILYNNINKLEEYIKTARIGRGKVLSRRKRNEVWLLIEKYNKVKQSLGYYHKEEIINLLSDFLDYNNIRPFEYCLIDELQDFSNIELRLVRSLVKEKSNDLFFVGDPLQTIYDRRINFTKVGIMVRGRSKRLRINYRTTEEIKKLAISIVQDCQYDNFDGEQEDKKGYVSLFHGVKPIYEIYKTKKDEIRGDVDKIQKLIENGYLYSDIAISARTKEALKDFQSYMHNNKIPYYKLENGIWSGTPEGLKLLTFHSIKGLEFKHVFIVDLNNRNFPRLPQGFELFPKSRQESYLQNEKSLIYVAVSRAIENVEISGVGQKTALIKL